MRVFAAKAIAYRTWHTRSVWLVTQVHVRWGRLVSQTVEPNCARTMAWHRTLPLPSPCGRAPVTRPCTWLMSPTCCRVRC
jgi:hypothetical protein